MNHQFSMSFWKLRINNLTHFTESGIAKILRFTLDSCSNRTCGVDSQNSMPLRSKTKDGSDGDAGSLCSSISQRNQIS